MTKEQKARLEELTEFLRTAECGTEEWDKAYAEYDMLDCIRHQEYRAANGKLLQEFYEKNIRGKSIDELRVSHAWDYYSDWHKDVYGYRPRFVNCVV